MLFSIAFKILIGFLVCLRTKFKWNFGYSWKYTHQLKCFSFENRSLETEFFIGCLHFDHLISSTLMEKFFKYFRCKQKIKKYFEASLNLLKTLDALKVNELNSVSIFPPWVQKISTWTIHGKWIFIRINETPLSDDKMFQFFLVKTTTVSCHKTDWKRYTSYVICLE